MSLNVQSDLRRRLAEELAPVEVRVSRPEGAPAELVTVRRDGGSRQDRLLDRPGIAIYCWAGSEERACELAEQVADAMERLPFEGGYALVSQDSMASDPDPDTRSPRWYLEYTITTFEPKEA